jgi:RNA polymerase sigma-54 factor
MLDRDNSATKDVRDYVRERYTSAIQLMKNIEQRSRRSSKFARALYAASRSFWRLARITGAHDDQGSG